MWALLDLTKGAVKVQGPELKPFMLVCDAPPFSPLSDPYTPLHRGQKANGPFRRSATRNIWTMHVQ